MLLRILFQFFGCILSVIVFCQQSENYQIQDRLDKLAPEIKETFRQLKLEKNDSIRKTYLNKYIVLISEEQKLNNKLKEIRLLHIRNQLQKETTDSIRILLLLELSHSQKRKFFDSSLINATTVLDLARKNNWRHHELEGLRLTGSIYEENFHYDPAMIYFKQAHDKAISDNQQERVPYANMFNVCFYQGNYQYALQLCLEGLPWAEKTGDKKNEANFRNIMGAVFNAQGNTAEAHKHYQAYETIAKNLDDSAMLAHVYREWSQVFFDQHQLDSALYYLIRSNTIYNIVFSNYTVAQTNTIYKISRVYKLKGDFTTALTYALQSVEMPGETNPFELPLYYINLGEIYFKLGKPKLALENYHMGLSIAKGIRHAEDTRDAYFSLSEFYRNEKKFDSAYYYYNNYVFLKDSVINDKTRQNIAFMQSQFNSEKKDQQIKDQQAKLKRQSLLRNIIIGSSVGLLLVVWLFYNSYRLKQKNKFQQQLNKQQNELINTVIAVQDKERKRIAEDLHDSIGSILSAAKLKLSAIAETANANGNGQNNNYDETLNLLDEAVNEMRSISHNLLPASLLRLGLVPGLQNLFDRISSKSGLQISFNIYGFKNRLDESVEVSIYRIILEAVNNIMKHAKAKNVTIQLMQYDNYINLLVEDDGVGFDKAEMGQHKGIGLNNIFSRVDYMKGKVDIDTKPRAGTVINIDIPYQQKI